MALKKKNKDIAKRRQAREQKKARIKKAKMNPTHQTAPSMPIPANKDYAPLLQKMGEMGNSVHLVENAAGERKLSEVLLEFAAPLITATDGDPNGEEKAIMVAVVLWNLAVLPEQELAKLKQDISTKIAEKDPSAEGYELLFEKGFNEMFEIMNRRKQALFPEDKRLVVDFSLENEGKKKRLLVASGDLSEETAS
uniref:Uncharacterized protein n=1 Tax=Candidatus Kentrum sp. FM TaxID=2126340 RepID=A0A450SQA4_9GAMM|nr:MAG: hypothetical protein BECKFM1743C_GA0114222_101715 [Candidatus Kentron sp. FM]VFJ59015.1 MAG: hypothetical protein BECKFM1743A_GA0114220_102294 [Candidatus Kentron sp. FM]VFK11937.1 MAG: hypothetical protein BECKFM1743B_GA0114221_102163 [Candidatus Kentron sp. FM]